ncbi:hypothetical protein DVH24_027621, partial [Malus domestica]
GEKIKFLLNNKKGRTQCTRLPLYAGSERGECRLALPPFMERLLPSLEPETYRSWAKALAIAPIFLYLNAMTLYNNDDAWMCKMFPSTMKGLAMRWFSKYLF